MGWIAWISRPLIYPKEIANAYDNASNQVILFISLLLAIPVSKPKIIIRILKICQQRLRFERSNSWSFFFLNNKFMEFTRLDYETLDFQAGLAFGAYRPQTFLSCFCLSTILLVKEKDKKMKALKFIDLENLQAFLLYEFIHRWYEYFPGMSIRWRGNGFFVGKKWG